MSSLADQLAETIAAANIAGASVAIFRGGKIEQAQAGFAQFAPDQPVSAATRFQIGSISKVFTATLISKLAEDGKLKLDAPVTKYLPRLKIANEAPPKSFTVRTLLDYTAGVEGDYFADFGEDDTALEQYAAACSDLLFMHEPGKYRAYNSTAYCIAGRVIEAVTSKYFDDALTDLLLRPIGLDRFDFHFAEDQSIPRADGQHWSPEEQAFISSKGVLLPRAMTAAGARLSMSAQDLLSFGLLHLFDGKAVNGKRYAKSRTIKAMRQPYGVVPPNDSERLMGWAAQQYGKDRITIAAGETVNQNALIAIAPKQKFAISILTNVTSGASAIFATLGIQLLREIGIEAEFPTPDLTPGKQGIANSQIVGRYTNFSLYEVIEDDGDLKLNMWSKRSEADDAPAGSAFLIPLGDKRFGLAASPAGPPASAIEFHFFDRDRTQASHISQAGRLFARLSS